MSNEREAMSSEKKDNAAGAGIRLVAFDWGGVILKICRSWAEGCSAAGIDVRAAATAAEGVAARKAISDRFQRGELTEHDYFRLLSESVDGIYTPQEVERVHHAWLIAEYPGVDELVHRLNATRGVDTALLSNTNPHHWRRQVRDFPTASRLRHRHASHIMGLAKPDPAIYRDFERRTGVRPQEILFFDDLAENISAARACGWRCEQIDHTGDTAAQMAAHLVRHGVWDA